MVVLDVEIYLPCEAGEKEHKRARLGASNGVGYTRCFSLSTEAKQHFARLLSSRGNQENMSSVQPSTYSGGNLTLWIKYWYPRSSAVAKKCLREIDTRLPG